jgi:UDP-N-acetylmuramoyl-L-alanyl-D-glutamate--2,6-diaminopimelate ligase
MSDVRVTDVTDDSRAVQAGSMFVAVRGGQFDGHMFLDDALRAGAAAVVTDRQFSVPPGRVGLIVNDTRLALARLTAAHQGLRGSDRRDLRLIGITGTNGKTTTAWLLRSILRSAGIPTALLGTIEYDLVAERTEAPQTTPGPALLAKSLAAAHDAGAKYAVFEASSHALDQKRCDGLAFSAGVFTNLSGDHLDYHATMGEYAAAKRRLFDLREAEGVAVINIDDETGRSMAGGLPGRTATYAMRAGDAEVTAVVESFDVTGTQFRIRGPAFGRAGTRIDWPLVGEHNVYNALAAATTASALGLSISSIVDGLQNVSGVPGRLQRAEPNGFPFSVFVDYAHTDAALANVLSALRPLTKGRLICVFGCGGERDRTKRPRMGQAVFRFADRAFVTSDNPRRDDPDSIIAEIVPGMTGPSRCAVHVDPDRRTSIETAIRTAEEGDIVLIAGKGHEKYQEINGVRHPFDDLIVARDCLESVYAVKVES